MSVDFKFILDQRVFTTFNEEGIVVMLGVDDGGKQYHVKTKLDSQWYKEKELKIKQ